MKIDDGVVQRFERAQDRLVLQTADLSLETIAAMVDQGAIDVQPGYQRRERWRHVAEADFGTYSVIDGKQRATPISGFMRNLCALSPLHSCGYAVEAVRS